MTLTRKPRIALTLAAIGLAGLTAVPVALAAPSGKMGTARR